MKIQIKKFIKNKYWLCNYVKGKQSLDIRYRKNTKVDNICSHAINITGPYIGQFSVHSHNFIYIVTKFHAMLSH